MPSLAKPDWEGDAASSADEILLRVAARARVLPQLEPNELPKTLDWPRMLVRCGMLPARSLDRSAAVPGFVDDWALLKALSAADAEVEPGLNGLVDGVGLDVLDAVLVLMLVMPPGAEILEGRVPARPRRAGLLMPDSVRGTRSGKPS